MLTISKTVADRAILGTIDPAYNACEINLLFQITATILNFVRNGKY